MLACRLYFAILLAAFATVFMKVQVVAAEGVEEAGVAQYSLDNGLKIIVIPDRRAPVVTHMIWYKVGSADEERGKSGLAHFLEHLMFKGTSNYAAGQFSDDVAAIGGEENAFTTADYTAYYQRVASDALAMVMGYEADRMHNLVLDDDTVRPERDVVLQERRQRIDSRPGGILAEAMDAALYDNHPYGIPVIGWEHEVAQLNAADAIRFYERHYRPDNAILVVSGDVNPPDVLDLARQTYGKIMPRGAAAPRARPGEPPPRTARTVTYSDPRVTAPSLRRRYLAPSYRQAAPREAEALELLGAILGGVSSSRMKRELLVDEPVAASAGAYYSGGAYDSGEFAIYAAPLPGHELGDLEAKIDAIVERIKADGVSETELEAAKSHLVKTAMFDRDSQTSMARLYGSVLASGGTVEDVLDWPDAIRSVTLDDVNRAARIYLDKGRSVTGYLRKESSS